MYSLLLFEFPHKLFPDNVLRFNSIQIAEWIHQLMAEKDILNQRTLSYQLGVDRTRPQQFLYLLRVPVDVRARLKKIPGLTEGELRPMTKLMARDQRAAAGRFLGTGL